MTTQKLPGTDAARHGTGDADLTIMFAAHSAFRRDLARLVRAAAVADRADPAKRQSVAAGWELFKRELHMHHTAEDELIWPVLRPRGGDVRLDPGRHRPRAGRRHPGPAPAAAAPALPGRLEAPLREDPALVTPLRTVTPGATSQRPAAISPCRHGGTLSR